MYRKLEKDALSFYDNFRSSHRHDLSRFFLKLTQKLNPMRGACSGGRYPLEDSTVDSDGDESVESSENRRPKKTLKYSEFEFTSKFRTLISELERIRDEDSTCKFFDSHTQNCI